MPDDLVALVLAAGLSSRFGADKLLIPLAGKPLGAHVADTLAGLGIARRVAVCLTSTSDRIAIYASRGFDLVANPAPQRGLSSSLALGVERAMALGADRLLVCLGDMPFVTADHLIRLIAASETADLVATAWGDRRSPPAVFGRRHLRALTTLGGDQGARQLLREAVPIVADTAIMRDVDTPADLG